MKKVGGALAGVVALFLPSKKKTEFNLDTFDPKMATIDSNSKWAKEWTYVQGTGYRIWWNRTLSQGEIYQMHQEPFAMFKPLKPIEPKLNPNHPLSRGLVSYELFTGNGIDSMFKGDAP